MPDQNKQLTFTGYVRFYFRCRGFCERVWKALQFRFCSSRDLQFENEINNIHIRQEIMRFIGNQYICVLHSTVTTKLLIVFFLLALAHSYFLRVMCNIYPSRR